MPPKPPITTAQRRRRALFASSDEVMCFGDLRLARVDAHVLENGSQSIGMTLHGFHGLVDHGDLHLIPRPEAHFELETVNGVNTQLPLSSQDGVVLLSSERGG